MLSSGAGTPSPGKSTTLIRPEATSLDELDLGTALRVAHYTLFPVLLVAGLALVATGALAAAATTLVTVLGPTVALLVLGSAIVVMAALVLAVSVRIHLEAMKWALIALAALLAATLVYGVLCLNYGQSSEFRSSSLAAWNSASDSTRSEYADDPDRWQRAAVDRAQLMGILSVITAFVGVRAPSSRGPLLFCFAGALNSRPQRGHWHCA
jgi:hypothetical protein